MPSFTRVADATLMHKAGNDLTFNKAHRVAGLWLADQGEPVIPSAAFRRLLQAVGVDLFEGEFGLALRNTDIQSAVYRRYMAR
ncbi:hypothetical protein [Streptomyces sp. NPDC079189]|uniref:hypothetical protein n=1 Tax=Streptomyces sp. NPDC079189 TaxID=3154514 RepID=UPI00341FD358